MACLHDGAPDRPRPFDVMGWTEIAIVAAVALVVAAAIRIFRARLDKRDRGPAHIHEPLVKRAETYADRSPFLRNICREFRANGHISNRQAEAVKKALARLEARSGQS